MEGIPFGLVVMTGGLKSALPCGPSHAGRDKTKIRDEKGQFMGENVKLTSRPAVFPQLGFRGTRILNDGIVGFLRFFDFDL